MSDATFTSPGLTTFTRLDDLGLVVVGQQVDPGRAVLACRVVEPDDWCRRCGCQGRARDTVIRRLAHVPFGWRPTTLLVIVRRYRCTGCGLVWRQDTSLAADPRAKLSRAAVRWALVALVVQHLTVARIAEALDVSWNTANDAVLAEGKRLLIDDPTRFDAVTTVGVDEHVWRHTRRGDKYVTVVIDLTPIRAGTGPARLLAMDGFTGFKTGITAEVWNNASAMALHLIMLFLAIVGWVSYFQKWGTDDLLLGQPFVLWMAGFCTAAVVLLSVLLNRLEGYHRP